MPGYRYINTPFISSAYTRKSGTVYYKTLYLNKSVLNPNYFDTNNSKLIITIANTDYEVDLTNNSTQTLSGYYAVTVTDDTYLSLEIRGTSTGDYPTGSITISSGNDNTGCTDNTYDF